MCANEPLNAENLAGASGYRARLFAKGRFMAHVLGMHVMLDGSPVLVDKPTLARALAAGAASARARGRVIIEAKADGITLTDDQLGSPSDELALMREVTLISAEPRALVKVTLDDAAVALRELVVEQRQAGALIHAGKEGEALERLQDIFKTWQNVKNIVEHSAQLLEQPLDGVALRGLTPTDSLEASSQRLVKQLQHVKASLTRQDWSALADTLEYDLCEEAQAWVRLLTSLADYVGTLPSMQQAGAGTGIGTVTGTTSAEQPG